MSPLLVEMMQKQPEEVVTIFEDNSGCVALVQGRQTTPRTKHVAVRIGFIRDMITNKVINVSRCPTKQMIADPLTKPLAWGNSWLRHWLSHGILAKRCQSLCESNKSPDIDIVKLQPKRVWSDENAATSSQIGSKSIFNENKNKIQKILWIQGVYRK